MRQTVSLHRLVAEGSVIIVSILLALAVQAWWEGRNETRQREALLDALRSDMALADVEVERVLRSHAAGRDAASTLLTMSVPDGPSADYATVVDSLLTRVIAAPSYDAPLGALEALLGSGDLQLVNDPELAVDLTAFPSLVADLDREQGLLIAAGVRLTDHLRAEGIDQSHLNVGTPVPWDLHPTTAYTLLADARLRSLLNEVYFRYRNSTIDIESIREAVDRIQNRLTAR